ncbi:MAG TPA: superoxide dismutase, Ni [Anaerolineae bacterium]|nr:superoxide dismutase, Ni [Anaerolineae bacterium]
MFNKMTSLFKQLFPADVAHAHCDGPCGVYDPAQARVHAEAVLSMAKKLNAIDLANGGIEAHNTFARYVAIKEEEAHATKTDLLVLWTDFFKPAHLKQFPNLHETIWWATKQCSACKTGVSVEDAEKLLAMVETIHNMFWQAKGRDVAWVRAS